MTRPQTCRLTRNQPCCCLMKHAAHFLDLPPSTRQQVYIYAGLPRNQELQLPHGSRHIDGQDRANITSLLLVCKTIHDDVEAALYFDNRFVVSDYRTDEALRSLSDISPRACRLLRDVVVRIRFDRMDHAPWRLGANATASTVANTELVRLWHVAVTHILDHAEPQALHLRLSIGSRNPDEMDQVLAPLRQYQGKLGQFDIILSRYRDPELIHLAERALGQITPRKESFPSSAPFRFADLPVEIRWRIYEYTELAMPLEEVQWTPERGFEVACTPCLCEDGCGCGEAETIHYVQDRLRCPAAQSMRFPCCSRNQSTASYDCQHWQGPLSLMLVSRAVYEEAVAFFYSRNKFTVLSGVHPRNRRRRNLQHRYRSPREMALRLFVKRLAKPQEVLRHLRHLTFFYPGLNPRSASDAYSSAIASRNKWHEAVYDLSRFADVPRLRLTMHLFSILLDGLPLEAEFFLRRGDINLIDAFATVLEPLKTLAEKGLGGLSVHIEWHSHSHSPQLVQQTLYKTYQTSPNSGTIPYHWIPSTDRTFLAIERQLEKTIMGEHYQSESRVVGEEAPSQTLRCLWDCRRPRMWLKRPDEPEHS